MKGRRYILPLLVVLLAAFAVVGGRWWAVSHVRRWSGRNDLGFTDCRNCHLQSIENLAWSQPRLRHPAPAGIVCSSNASTLYIACDDTDEVLEADVRSKRIQRKLALPGAPCALALDEVSHRLFVTC